MALTEPHRAIAAPPSSAAASATAWDRVASQFHSALKRGVMNDMFPALSAAASLPRHASVRDQVSAAFQDACRHDLSQNKWLSAHACHATVDEMRGLEASAAFSKTNPNKVTWLRRLHSAGCCLCLWTRCTAPASPRLMCLFVCVCACV
jgi:hypothetical protein